MKKRVKINVFSWKVIIIFNRKEGVHCLVAIKININFRIYISSIG